MVVGETDRGKVKIKEDYVKSPERSQTKFTEI